MEAFSGSLESANGSFTGIFDTTALKLEPGTGSSQNVSLSSDYFQSRTLYNILNGYGISDGAYIRVSSNLTSVVIHSRKNNIGQDTHTVNISDLTYMKISYSTLTYRIYLYDSNKILIPATILSSLPEFSTQTLVLGYSGGKK